MPQQMINIGAAPNDGTGDPIRDAFDKANDNFTELYAGLVGLLDLKGSTDASGNPNYPAASKGDTYVVSVAGRVGGAAGPEVHAGDVYFATADNAGGTQAAVGASWAIIEHNIGTVGGGTIAVEDEGVEEGAAIARLNFTGAGVSVVVVGDEAQVDIPGGGGGVIFATAAEVRTGTEAAEALSPANVFDAAAVVALTPGANVALDLASGFNFSLAMGGNYTLDNPTNPKVGQSGFITVTQDGTGSRTLAYGANWEFAGGTVPVLSTAAAAKDLLFYQVLSATSIFANLVKAVA